MDSVILFGSSVTGKMNKDSDIDLIVVSTKYGRKDTFTVTPKLYNAWHGNQKLNLPVDILLFNLKEFEKLKSGVNIVSEALREGIRIT